ncbi:hypothetical protein C1646_758117 [Rhizophagus diaphanus]|nr:hypothetical protein C1646_758117 [Rhizophagus diaphanus] [Rhizophagus sp. MUCL 43196]
MAFYWRENDIYAKQGERESIIDDWTTFLFDMREPIELPDVQEFARFLINSLGFTENLQDITVHFNDKLVIQLSKKIQGPKFTMEITPEFNRLSSHELFYLSSVDFRDVRLNIERLLVPDTCTGKFNQISPSSIFLNIVSGNLDVRADYEFSAEMKRITKKELPRETTIQMIYARFDEQNSSGNCVSPVFKDLFPYPEQGRIHIGFSTNQTTGCCFHLSTRVIPTVERESIDLLDMTLTEYNSEILCLTGTLCRILYESEMIKINRRSVNTQSLEWLEEWAARALTHFTFNTTTPNEQVGEIIESQFFNCSEEKLAILSTTGVLPIFDVRIPNLEMVGFIKTVPLVPTIIFEQCKTFFKKAQSMKFIRELNFLDVLIELENREFSENEMIELLKWLISYLSKGNIIDASDFERFMEIARIGNDFRPLKTILCFLNPGTIPSSVDVPDFVLPYTISKNLKSQDLIKWFKWSELSLVDWARFISNKPNLETDPTFVEKVYEILAGNFNKFSIDDKRLLCQLFEQKKCIPTKFGMKIPNEAYFEGDLMELFGVRKVVEINLIIDRLTNYDDCDYMQLIKYLASKSNDLKQNDKNMLKSRNIWPKENPGSQQIQHYVISDLHIPLELHRELGLPVIDWKVRWVRDTPEERFLIELGIQQYPTIAKILELAAPTTYSDIRYKALRYFINNFDRKYYRNYYADEINVAFLPCLHDNYAKPLECFINPECTVMSFKVINRDLQNQVGKLGVRQHPNREELLSKLLQNPPRDVVNAEKFFGYLASRQTDFNHSDWNRLVNFNFIPIRNQSNEIILTSPCKCFFKFQDELKDLFLQIDFGEKANRFLQSCGVKDEPSSIEYAELLVKSSHELLKLIGIEKYLNILRKIANGFSNFGNMANKIGLALQMKKAPILVAITKEYREIKFEMKEPNIYRLGMANRIYINDDKIYQGIFNPLTAPEEDNLEIFYKKLGCKSLRDSVNETSMPRGSIRVTDKSKKFQEIIIERASLYYFRYPKGDIKSDEKWLKKLKVREIDYIETSYTLGNTKKTKKNNTSILQDDNKIDSRTLYITSNSTSLDISKHIAKNIYKSHEWKNIFAVNTILTASLLDLKEMGYPVNLILQQVNFKR